MKISITKKINVSITLLLPSISFPFQLDTRLTRAKERLVVIAGPSRSRVPWIEALAPWGYDPTAPPEDGATLLDGRVPWVEAALL